MPVKHINWLRQGEWDTISELNECGRFFERAVGLNLKFYFFLFKLQVFKTKRIAISKFGHINTVLNSVCHLCKKWPMHIAQDMARKQAKNKLNNYLIDWRCLHYMMSNWKQFANTCFDLKWHWSQGKYFILHTGSQAREYNIAFVQSFYCLSSFLKLSFFLF